MDTTNLTHIIAVMNPYGPQKKLQCALPAGAVVWNTDNGEYHQITGDRRNLYWLTLIKIKFAIEHPERVAADLYMPSITWVECDADVAEEALNKACQMTTGEAEERGDGAWVMTPIYNPRQITTEALLPNPYRSAMDHGDRYLIADAGTFKLTYDRQTKIFELGHCAEE